MSVQRKPVSIGNVSCHADILNLTTLASIGVGREGVCIWMKRVAKTRVMMIKLSVAVMIVSNYETKLSNCFGSYIRYMELEGADEDVRKIAMVLPILALSQNEATVDLFAVEIHIHKQPLDAADILNFHIIKKNRDVNYLAIGYILYKSMFQNKLGQSDLIDLSSRHYLSFALKFSVA
ncbi:hypothetical protein Tco_0331907 [Tanacetum coccineum]